MTHRSLHWAPAGRAFLVSVPLWVGIAGLACDSDRGPAVSGADALAEENDAEEDDTEGGDSEGCAGEAEAEAAALVHGMYADVFNEHDLERAKDYIRVDYIQHNPMVGQGLDGFVAYFEGFFAAAPDTTVELLDTVVQGDRVVVYTRIRGTWDGPFGELQVQAKPFDFMTMDIFRIEDGLLAEHWDVVDTLSLLTQLGALG